MDYRHIKQGDLLQYIADRQMGVTKGTIFLVLSLTSEYANCCKVLRLDNRSVVTWHIDNLAQFCDLMASA